MESASRTASAVSRSRPLHAYAPASPAVAVLRTQAGAPGVRACANHRSAAAHSPSPNNAANPRHSDRRCDGAHRSSLGSSSWIRARSLLNITCTPDVSSLRSWSARSGDRSAAHRRYSAATPWRPRSASSAAAAASSAARSSSAVVAAATRCAHELARSTTSAALACSSPRRAGGSPE
jgi:hypothetical protein